MAFVIAGTDVKKKWERDIVLDMASEPLQCGPNSVSIVTSEKRLNDRTSRIKTR